MSTRLGLGGYPVTDLRQHGASAAANGDTVIVSLSIINGALTAGASISGVLQSVSDSLVSGTASASAVATGDTITLPASALSGTVSGNAAASGDAVLGTGSVLSGSVSGNANASPQIVTASSELIEGIASGTSESTAFGSLLSATISIITGDASATSVPTFEVSGPPIEWPIPRHDGFASGVVLTARCRILSGKAKGKDLKTYIYRGIASGNAIAPSNVITLYRTLESGAATGEKYLSDDEQLMMIFAEAA